MHCNGCKIIYTDTDSLIYHIECNDIYDIMKRNIARSTRATIRLMYMICLSLTKKYQA